MRLLLLRFLYQLAFAIWLGGFTFYSAVVIPVLHEELGRFDTGLVTQQVTRALNTTGCVAVFLGWMAAWAERSNECRWISRVRLGLLAATTILLLALLSLHPIMDARLASGSLRGFYPLHRIYLNLSTSQWVVNLGLLAVACRHGRGEVAARPLPGG